MLSKRSVAIFSFLLLLSGLTIMYFRSAQNNEQGLNPENTVSLAEAVCNSRQKRNADGSCTTCEDFTKVSADGNNCETPICKFNEVIEFDGSCVPCGLYRIADPT